MDDNNLEKPSADPIPPVTPPETPASVNSADSSSPAPAEPTPTSASDSDPSISGLSSADAEPSITSSVSSATPFRSAPPEKKSFPLKPVVIILVVLALGGVAAFFLLNKTSTLLLGGLEPVSGISSEIVYSTPPDSTDPIGDYISHLEERIASASTQIEKLSATLDLADFLTRNDQATRAIAILDSVSTADFSSDREYYAFYSAYAKAYSPSYLNDPELYAEFSTLASQYNPNPPAPAPAE